MATAMATSRRQSHLFGALVIISYFSIHQAVSGFLIAPHCQASSRKRTSVKAINSNIGDDDWCNLNRRSAIAIGAAAALAPLCIPTLPANAAASSIPDWTLDGGVKFPMLALNTAGMSTEEAYKAIEFAKKEGINHIDFHPGKERDGMATYLSKHRNERDSFFLNTKIRKPPIGTSPEDAATLARDQINDDLRVLNVKNVDMLMLRDSPDPKNIQAQWAVLEEALAEGKTRSIGVINYCPGALKTVLQSAKVTPAVNYYMVHVGMGNDPIGLRTLGEKSGIRTFSYGQTGEFPVGQSGSPGPNEELLNSPILKRIGNAHGKSSGEVALRWVLQNGIAASVRPSPSYNRCEGKECQSGIAKQVGCFDWTLTDKDMEELDAMTSPADNPTLFSTAGCPGAYGT